MTSGQSRMALWAIIILVILNVGLMGLLWYQRLDRTRPFPPQQQQGRGTSDFLARELGLDENGARALRALQEEHFRRADSLQRAMGDLNHRLFEQIFTPEPDTVSVRALSDSIGVLRAEFERGVASHFWEVKKLCKPEKYETLRRLLFDAIERPGPRQDGAPPPPRGR